MTDPVVPDLLDEVEALIAAHEDPECDGCHVRYFPALIAELARYREALDAVRELCVTVENRMMATAKPSEILAALSVLDDTKETDR